MAKHFLPLLLLLLCILIPLLSTANDPPLVWAVRLAHSDHTRVAKETGLVSSGHVNELLDNVYEFKLGQEDHSHLLSHLKSRDLVIDHVHSNVLSHPHVQWAEHQFSITRDKRDIYFNDPLFSHQWHLVINELINGDLTNN